MCNCLHPYMGVECDHCVNDNYRRVPTSDGYGYKCVPKKACGKGNFTNKENKCEKCECNGNDDPNHNTCNDNGGIV